jgi:hypothetical protein
VVYLVIRALTVLNAIKTRLIKIKPLPITLRSSLFNQQVNLMEVSLAVLLVRMERMAWLRPLLWLWNTVMAMIMIVKSLNATVI